MLIISIYILDGLVQNEHYIYTDWQKWMDQLNQPVLQITDVNVGVTAVVS